MTHDDRHDNTTAARRRRRRVPEKYLGLSSKGRASMPGTPAFISLCVSLIIRRGSDISKTQNKKNKNKKPKTGRVSLSGLTVPVVSLESNLTWKATIRLNSHFFRINFKDHKRIAIFNT
jgi:hypothetical protein